MMSLKRKKHRIGSSREYIIALTRWNSRLALIACFITVFFSLYSIACGIILYVSTGQSVKEFFHYFTINSNFLTAFSASMIIPYAIEGIRKKHFSYPKWIAVLHYSGLVCTTLTMVFAIAIISWVDPVMAFGGYNFNLHLLCPIMVIVSFFLVESGYHFSMKNAFLAELPTLIYMVIYFIEVVVIGKENGGWEDLYYMTVYAPIPVSIVLVLLLTTSITLLLRWLHNKLNEIRARRMAARLWPKDVEPVEINIEIFGLGRYMGRHSDGEYIEIPLDLIQMLATEYDLDTEKLIKPFIRGYLDSMNDMNELHNRTTRSDQTS